MMALIFLKTAFLAVAAHLMLSPLGSELARFAGYAMILGTLLYVLSSILEQTVNRAVLWVFAMMCWLMLMGVGGDVTPLFDYMKSAVSLVCLLLCFFIKPRRYSQRTLRFFFGVNRVQAVLYAAYTFLPFSFRYTVANEYGYMQFTMSLGNPNATSIAVLSVIMLLILELYTGVSRSLRAVDLLLCVLLARTLWMLESRTILTCLLLYLLLLFLQRRGRRFGKLLFWGAVLLSAASLGVHLALAHMDEIVLFGKPLASGRSELFRPILEQIRQAPLQYLLGRPDLHQFGNYHNGPLSLICNIGLLGTLVYYSVWNRGITQILNNRSTLAPVAYLALIVFIIGSSSEAAPMLGGIPYSLQIMLFIRMGIDHFDGLYTEQAQQPERQSV